MKTVAIVQSNYIPWRGYFDLIGKADLFILLDVVQYTRRDWRNRNTIKTPSGPAWLSIPVAVRGRYGQAVDETQIADVGWAEHHIRSLTLNYRRAAAFGETAPWLFESLQQAATQPMLSRSNAQLLAAICSRLSISTPIIQSSDLVNRDELCRMQASERLLRLCQAAGASRYLSGPAAQSYLDESAFRQEGIAVAWMDYGGYREYPQLWGPFAPSVSIVDLLLNCGDAARNYLGRS
jgi:hypothetical protein